MPKPKKIREAKITAELRALEKNGELAELMCERCDESLGYAELPTSPAAYCNDCVRALCRERIEMRDSG